MSFLWHMHQPWYGEPQSGRMAMPWVRLHALKDYLDMIAAAEAHPAAHLGFNLVPSLLLQLQLYVDGQTTDRAAECARRPAADLSQEEQLWLLDNGFKCHWPRWVDPVPRFRELLEKRGRTPSSLERARQRYTPQDYRDLQVWSHLAWCGYELRTHHPLVRELLAKGTGYSEDEKSALLDALDAVLPTILPRYLAAARQGHVELTTTPFYHPILPLLCHYPDARAAMPGCRLPRNATDL
ncbi:MAG: hypothetical protein HUU35_14445, partial [Armatimonadetes bacterium]|nr:hypothetical protein [Armatimonadota bacterium]